MKASAPGLAGTIRCRPWGRRRPSRRLLARRGPLVWLHSRATGTRGDPASGQHREVVHGPDPRILDSTASAGLVARFRKELEPGSDLREPHNLIRVHLGYRLDRVHVGFNSSLGFRHAGGDGVALSRIRGRDLKVLVELCVVGRDGQVLPSMTLNTDLQLSSWTTGSYG